MMKKSMMIYCERCGYEKEYSKLPPLKCPKCKGGRELSFEKESEWHPLLEMWARANGYSPGHSSLPQWFFITEKVQEWWEDFKSTLSNPEAIEPPNLGQAEEFWKEKSGLRAVLVRGVETIYSGLGISGEDGAEEFLNHDPKVKELMTDYLLYWKKRDKGLWK